MKRFYSLSCAVLLLLMVRAVAFPQPVARTVEPEPKKFALLIGIDAYQHGLPTLEGCAKDAKDMAGVLTAYYKFSPHDLQTLTDKSATRQGILAALNAQEARAKKGDLFVFYYSGHGSLFPDAKSEDRDETESITPPDGKLKRGKYDSALCPVDTGSAKHSGKPWQNLILDDELYACFSRFTQKGCAVIFIADSCHSGTIGKGSLNVIKKSLELEDALGIKFDEIPVPEIARDIKPPEMRGQYLILSSSQDNQYSGATEKGSLFTSALLETLRLNPKRSYKDLNEIVRRKVKRISEDTQEPHLDTRFYKGSLEATFMSFLEFSNSATDNVTTQSTPVTVKFLVTDSKAQPLRNVTITINQVNNPGVEYTCKTTANGIGSIQKRVLGEYRVSIRHPNYTAIDKAIEISESPLNPGHADLFVRLKAK